jgi:multidrug efflux pump subunit AcrA (membrane-fusion protein)
MIRWGGPWYLRWSARLLLLIGAVLVCFIPYHREAGGECRVAPAAQRSLRALNDDEVLHVFVKTGDRVSVDNPIVTLATRKDLAAVANEKAALEKANANLELLTNGPRQEELAIAEQKVEMWKAQAEYSQTQLKRIRELQKQDSASQKELDQAITADASAQGEFLNAKEALLKLHNGTRSELIREAKAQVEMCKADLAYHQELVKLGQITAPIAGRVATPNLEERVGMAVKAGELVATIVDDSHCYVEVFLEEPDAALVQPGMPVNVRLWGHQGELLTGKVRSITPATEELALARTERYRSDREEQARDASDHETNRRLRVLVDLDSTDLTLVSGMTGYGRIVLDDGVFGSALLRPINRFFSVELWSWLP